MACSSKEECQSDTLKVEISKFSMPTMEKIMLEIRNAEGGSDAKLLVEDMTDLYIKTCKAQDFH